MLVSVVVPMLNAERTLAVCLGALTTQDHAEQDHEILLVDNGCTDRSVEIARRFGGVTLLAEPAHGAYSARNHGILRARGDVIAFTDPDCVPDRSWIREIVEAFSDPGLDVLCGRRLPGRRSPVMASVLDYENAKADFVLGGVDEGLYFGYTSNMGVRKHLFDSLGLFLNRPRGADTLFVRKVASERSCAAIRYVPAVVVTHLELDRLSVYFKKVFIYGRHRRRNNPILRSRPLGFKERMTVFRRTVRSGRYPRTRAAVLLAVLGVGSLAWAMGGMSATIRAET